MKTLARFTALMLLIGCSTAAAQTGTVLFEGKEPPSQPPGEPPRNPVTILIFADGNIRKSVSEATGQSTAAAGEDGGDAVARLGLGKVNGQTGETWSGVVTVASTSKRIESDFIANVLAPGTGAGFHSGLLEYRTPRRNFGGRHPRFKRAFLKDWHLYTAVAASDWDSAGTPIRAVLFGLSALRVFTPISNKVGGSRVGLSIELGPSMRIIGGDVTLTRHKQFRSTAVGSTKNTFIGVELGMQIYIQDIAASLQLYRFAKGDAEVAGLTRTQLLASVNVRAPLFSGNPE